MWRFFLFVWMSNEPHLWFFFFFFLPTAGSLWVLLSPSPACGPQVYIHLVIFFKYSNALISSWLFCFVSLFLTFVTKPVALWAQLIFVFVCAHLHSCESKMCFVIPHTVAEMAICSLLLYMTTHTRLSCGFFFMWVDNKESIALSKVLLCAASVAGFQPVIMMPCGLVSGYDSDKRCLTKVSSLLVRWPLVLMGFQESVSRSHVKCYLFVMEKKIFTCSTRKLYFWSLNVYLQKKRYFTLFKVTVLLPEDSAECWFCVFALQCQQTMVNGVISCCASAHISRSSSFSLTRMLYLSRHVYEISENTNFLFHCAFPMVENPPH